MQSPFDQYVDNCRFSPLPVSPEEMELAQRSESYSMTREDVDLVVLFMSKQGKLNPKLRQALSRMKNFVLQSDEMRKMYQELAKRRQRENTRREKLKKAALKKTA